MDKSEDDFDFDEHMKMVKSKFEQIEQKNKGIGKGITYNQFRELFRQEMGVEFEDEDEFKDICSKLDHESSGNIIFERMFSFLKQDSSEIDLSRSTLFGGS
jgi:hypothetical protein